MSMVTVKLDYETVDGIVVDQLVDTLENLQSDLENRKAGHGLAIFEHDQNADIKILREHVDAFKVVLSYFGHGKE
jgi:hypothetical protein